MEEGHSPASAERLSQSMDDVFTLAWGGQKGLQNAERPAVRAFGGVTRFGSTEWVAPGLLLLLRLASVAVAVAVSIAILVVGSL